MPKTWTSAPVPDYCQSLLRRDFLKGMAVSGAAVAALGLARAQTMLRADYQQFIAEVTEKHAIPRAWLQRLFADVKSLPWIIRAMNAPSTSRPWHEFRKSHVTAARIDGGVRFWQKHAATLARAARDFGVPEEIMVATVGIETHYGGYTGEVRILDALATLAFDYPKRAAFFRDELEQYLLIGRETSLDIGRLRGSYAGAMGMPQFLPSSFRKFAVDFDGDGQRNLWRSVPDIVASVANYYKLHDWQPDEAVVVPAQVSAAPDATLTEDITPKTSIAEFRKLGVAPSAPVSDEALAALLPLETESGMQYWFGLKNFYVITRYNRSTNYAMAVHDIAQGIKTRMKGS